MLTAVEDEAHDDDAADGDDGGGIGAGAIAGIAVGVVALVAIVIASAYFACSKRPQPRRVSGNPIATKTHELVLGRSDPQANGNVIHLAHKGATNAAVEA